MSKGEARPGWREKRKKQRLARNIYYDRTRAVERLGLKLKDFRSLCIYKGVFPRVPKVANAGADKIYYHAKDIRFLRAGSALDTLLKRRVCQKRIRRYIAKRDLDLAKRVHTDAPEVDFSVILRQRYPTFDLALEDLDDALSCLALFTIISVDNEEGISAAMINESVKLIDHWNLLVSHCGLLNRTFASIKGYYYEATVCGKQVMWLTPHEFTTTNASGGLKAASNEVDFGVLKAFLELYHKHVAFVLYKLYNRAGYSYPPARIHDTNRADGRFLNYRLELLPGFATPVHKNIADQSPSAITRRQLFKQQQFWISRETPVWQLLFVLKSCGVGKIGFDEAVTEGLKEFQFSELAPDSQHITHHVVDRPQAAFERLLKTIGSDSNRIFVQPQWVLDSTNCNALLPTTPYAVGIAPPPHLSPWVDDEAEGHVPDQRKILEEWSGAAPQDLGIAVESKLPEELERFEEVRAVVEHHQAELKGTTEDTPLSAKLDSIRATTEKKQERITRERGRVSLSSKKRAIFNQLSAQEQEKRAEAEKLAERAKKAKAKAAK